MHNMFQITKYRESATKVIHNLQNYAYGDHLVELNLPLLKYRRRRGDMIMIYQLLHNNLNVDPSEFLTSNSSSITRCHNYKLFKPQQE